MIAKTQKEQIRELCQAVIGIPENDDENGLIGDIKDLVELIKEQNGRVRRNTRSISIIVGILSGLGLLGGLEIGNVIHLIGG